MPSVTLKQAVEYTGKSKRTIQRYIKAGKLKAVIGEDGKNHIELGSLIAEFGDPVTPETYQDPDLSHQLSPSGSLGQIPELMATVEAQSRQLAELLRLVAKQGEQLSEQAELLRRLEYKPDQKTVSAQEQETAPGTAQVRSPGTLPGELPGAHQPARPEDDPDWPKTASSMADLAKRREIRERYEQS